MIMEKEITAKIFTEIASVKLDFLQGLGFRRNRFLEENSSTSCCLVYAGLNIAFVVSLDMRDQCIDDAVVRICDGVLEYFSFGGTQIPSVFSYLVCYKGYRGRYYGCYKKIDNPKASELEHRLNGYISLLLNAGQYLLEDNPDTFEVSKEKWRFYIKSL